MKRALLLVALLLGGCTVGPNYERPTTAVPPSFAGAHNAAGASDSNLASWWTSFGDPELAALVNRALARNLDIESAGARIREARAQESVVGSSAAPQLTVQGSVNRQRISENAIPVPPGAGSGAGAGFGLPGSEFTTLRVGFDASWEIDLFGKTRRSLEAARGRTETAIWNRRDAEVTVAAEVARTYLALRSVQQKSAIAQAEIDRQQRALEVVQVRVRGGLVTGQDAEQQAASLASAKAALAPLQGEAMARIHALGVLTGDTPEALSAKLRQARPLPQVPTVPAGLPSDLLRRRPDIRAAERSLAAATADIGVATADLYPRFSLTAAPALVSTALSKLLEWGGRSFTVGASANWPLFNGGRTRANIAVANARQEQALIAYRKTILTALQDVEDALSAIDADRRQAASLDQALGNARRSEEIARTRYKGGLVTYSEVLQAQAGRISLESQETEARGLLGRDTVALFKALGGGWPELAQPDPNDGVNR